MDKVNSWLLLCFGGRKEKSNITARMTSPSSDYLSDESEEGSYPTVVIPAPTPPTAHDLTLEDLLIMQQMGITLSDSESSPQGIQIPVAPGLLLMGNGPLPIQAEGEEAGYIINHVEEEEEEDEQEEEDEVEGEEAEMEWEE